MMHRSMIVRRVGQQGFSLRKNAVEEDVVLIRSCVVFTTYIETKCAGGSPHDVVECEPLQQRRIVEECVLLSTNYPSYKGKLVCLRGMLSSFLVRKTLRSLQSRRRVSDG